MTTTLVKNATQELLSLMEYHGLTDFSLELKREVGDYDLELSEGDESALFSLTDDELVCLEDVVWNWLSEKELVYREPLNGIISLEKGELRFDGEALTWVAVSV